MSSNIPQHKRMAMGEKPGFKRGGSVSPSSTKPLKSGMKDSPLETVKRNNGIPGMKKGGAC
jgi:hypothetical protein